MPTPGAVGRYRIGFLIPSLDGGGAESATINWVESLARRGHRVHVYTYVPGAVHGRTPQGADVARFPGRSRLARALGLPVWMRRRARADGLDVLIAVMTYANISAALGVGVLRLPGLSLLISEHNVATSAIPLNSSGAAAIAKRLLARMVYRRADGAIGVSHPVAADLVAGFGLNPARVFVLPYPIVDLPSFPREGLPAKLTVGFVGRFVQQKEPLLFLDTLAALSRQGIDVHGLMIGDGTLRSAIADRASELAVPITFVGWRTPWWTVDPSPDCLLLASSIEGLAIVLVESAAADIPVVARSNALGVADAVIPGMTGELALGDSPERLAAAVIRAVNRPDARSEPLAPWLDHFSVNRSTSLLLEAIEITRERAL